MSQTSFDRFAESTDETTDVWEFDEYGPTADRPIPEAERMALHESGGQLVDEREIPDSGLSLSDITDWPYINEERDRPDRRAEEAETIAELERSNGDSGKEYPGFESLDDDIGAETVDFPFHGSGRKSIRHKYRIDEDTGAILEVSLGFSEIWEDPSVNLDVAGDFGPGQHVRINPGRTDMAEKIVDGKDGHVVNEQNDEKTAELAADLGEYWEPAGAPLLTPKNIDDLDRFDNKTDAEYYEIIFGNSPNPTARAVANVTESIRDGQDIALETVGNEHIDAPIIDSETIHTEISRIHSIRPIEEKTEDSENPSADAGDESETVAADGGIARADFQNLTDIGRGSVLTLDKVDGEYLVVDRNENPIDTVQSLDVVDHEGDEYRLNVVALGGERYFDMIEGHETPFVKNTANVDDIRDFEVINHDQEWLESYLAETIPHFEA